jgi:sugar lactone lactonase YvrE
MAQYLPDWHQRRWLSAVSVLFFMASQGAHPAAQETFTFTTVAGRPATGSNNGGSDVASLNDPHAIAFASDGSLYIADTANHLLRRVTADGTVTTVAGVPGLPGAGTGVGPAARFNNPRGVTVDAAGVVYVADDSGIRRVGLDGVGSTLTDRHLFYPDAVVTNVVFDGGSGLFATTPYGIWRVNSSTGAPSLLAGTSATAGYVDALGNSARFHGPSAMVVDSDGSLLVSDVVNQRVRRVTADGTVTTLTTLPAASNGAVGAYGLARAADGALLVANTVTHDIYRVDPLGPVTLFAGATDVSGRVDGASASARFRSPRGLAVHPGGDIYVADSGNSAIRRITLAGTVSTAVGREGGPDVIDGPGRTARFNGPRGLAVATGGTVYVADAGNCAIRAIAPGGTTSTLAGATTPGGDACGYLDATGTAARFSAPSSVAIASDGTVYVADTNNHMIRRVSNTGVVTTVAGQSTPGALDGLGTAASFTSPRGLALAANGDLYVADTGNHLIRLITPSGQVTTVAGLAGQTGTTDGTGNQARFSAPTDVGVDLDGNVFVVDSGSRRIRKVASGGVVTTVLAGNNTAPTGLALDGLGNIYVASRGSHQISKVSTDGTSWSLVAPRQIAGYYDGPATQSLFRDPYDLAFDGAGNLYVSDEGNHAIRVGLVSPTAPAFTASPASASVNVGGTATFSVAVSGSLTPALQWQVSANGGTSWSDLSSDAQYSGATSQTLTITGVTTALHNARYRAVASNQSGQTISGSAPLTVRFIAVDRSSLLFRALTHSFNGLPFALTPAQTVTVTFSGSSSSWTASASQGWVDIAGGTGSGDGQFTVLIPSNLALGAQTLTATVTVTPTDHTLPAVTIPVTYEGSTYSAGSTPTFGPIGQVDTPAQHAVGVQGAVALTGWAVDDVGIRSVAVYRNCLQDEPQTNCQSDTAAGTSIVFIGNATVVPGARPDVEVAFPTYPTRRTAGWGMQVLTTMLPRTTGTYAPQGGQGPLTLYVIATDIEGNRVLLSRSHVDSVPTPTMLTLANDALAKPFGTIDVPAEGATVSGAVATFGWALTPDANTVADGTDVVIPPNGSSIVVFVDGLPISTVTYNQCRVGANPTPDGDYCRDDIASIFGHVAPQETGAIRSSNPTRHRNLDAGRGAIGSAVIDTTALTPGLHTLAWSVTDSANRVEGIGSRYFTVINGADTMPEPRAALARATGANAALDTQDVSPTTIRGRSGFDLTTSRVEIFARPDGVRQVTIPQSGRVELHLGAVREAVWLARDQVRPLPAGSHIDASSGLFTWAPGPAFVGTYTLSFLTSDGRVPVEITIVPPAPTRPGDSEIRMHVDSPTHDQSVGSTFTIAGWAFDPQAFTGSGIGAVHVWARPTERAGDVSPVFVGAAALGGTRPDVAAAFGLSSPDAGYSLTARLPLGTYEVTVFAWNVRTQRWEDARTLTVRVRW